MYIKNATSYEASFSNEEIEILEKARQVLINLDREMKNHDCNTIECVEYEVQETFYTCDIENTIEILDNLQYINSIYDC